MSSTVVEIFIDRPFSSSPVITTMTIKELKPKCTRLCVSVYILITITIIDWIYDIQRFLYDDLYQKGETLIQSKIKKF